MDLLQTKYLLDQFPNTICKARVSPDVIDFSVSGIGNNTPTGQAINLQVSAYMDAGREGYGIHARGLLLKFTNGVPPGYSGGTKLFIPILQSFRYRQYHIGLMGTFKGLPVQIVGKRPEVIGA